MDGSRDRYLLVGVLVILVSTMVYAVGVGGESQLIAFALPLLAFLLVAYLAVRTFKRSSKDQKPPR